MPRFRESTRVFWSRSGWAEIPAYFTAVKNHGWEVLWGAGVIGIPFTLITFVWLPSWWRAFGYMLALIVLVASYHLWRDNHLRLRPKLQVTKIRDQRWHEGMIYDKSPMPPNKKNGDAINYYFEVAGAGEASSIRDVRVQLSEINPPVRNLDWLPVLLFHKHDNGAGPRAQQFDLHPGDVKHIDLITAYRGDDKFEIRHIVDGVNRNIPAGGYRLTVTITASDTPKLSVDFDVSVDSQGLLQCNVVPSGAKGRAMGGTDRETQAA